MNLEKRGGEVTQPLGSDVSSREKLGAGFGRGGKKDRKFCARKNSQTASQRRVNKTDKGS